MNRGGVGDVSDESRRRRGRDADMPVETSARRRYYNAIPQTSTYETLATWVQKELDDIWPPGVTSKTPYSLDRKLRERASAWVAADPLSTPQQRGGKEL